MQRAKIMADSLYGLVAEFDNADALVQAVIAAREAGYRKMDAYSPFPVHGMEEALEFHDWRLPWLIFIGGITGSITAFGLQCFTSMVDYPWNVGGKPDFSWPQFI